MANCKKYKGKMIKLERIFQKYTDCDHGLTLKQISEKLNEVNDSADRKTLYRDFNDLRGAGIEIQSRRNGKGTIYFVDDDLFTAEELEQIILLVKRSKLPPNLKKTEIIPKLLSLTSENRAKKIEANVKKKISKEREKKQEMRKALAEEAFVP